MDLPRLSRLASIALKVPDTVRAGAWGASMAQRALGVAVEHDPALAFHATQWARCAWAGGHDWPRDEAGEEIPGPCKRCTAERGSVNLLDLIREARGGKDRGR